MQPPVPISSRHMCELIIVLSVRACCVKERKKASNSHVQHFLSFSRHQQKRMGYLKNQSFLLFSLLLLLLCFFLLFFFCRPRFVDCTMSGSMNGGGALPAPAFEPTVLYISTNQDQSCFVLGTSLGFIVYSTDPLRERFRKGLLPPICVFVAFVTVRSCPARISRLSNTFSFFEPR